MSGNLVEIKKGQTGKGILIEKEGVLSLNEDTRRLCEGVESDKWFVPHPFVVDAVFQKYGIENANGRIYPEAILKREVEKYQTKIKERRAYGECYTPDAMVLTVRGWVLINKITEQDVVLTLNPKTYECSFDRVINVIVHTVKDKMYEVKGPHIHDKLTPNHSYPVYIREDEIYQFDGFKTMRELESIEHKEKYFIPYGIDDINDMDCLKEFSFSSYDYEGDVYCIEVPSHVWYVKQNDKRHWTKNCNHPSESVIDLGRICMNIVELHWENRTLVGKMEIETSRAFRQMGAITCLGDMVANHLIEGYKIGVSSRGVGSVEQKLGKLVVGDDYELICWDVVSDPSTPNAWICQDGINDVYVENTKTTKPLLNEKLDKIENLLIDF